MSRRVRAAGSVAVGLALGLVSVGGAAPAAAVACGGTAGVTVVVDGGAAAGTSTRCAAGNPASGLAALSGAGHRYAFVPRQPGFVCTIDGAPDPCNGAPSSAYWSYWHAQPGGSWVYSSLGAGSYDPAAGAVEGWAFGAGSPPGVRPPAAAAPVPSTTASRTTAAPVPSTSTTRRPAPTRTSAPSLSTSRSSSSTTSVPVPSTTSGQAPSAPAVTRPTTAPTSSPALTAPASPVATPPPAGPTPNPGLTVNPGDSTASAQPVATGTAGTGGPAGLAVGGLLVAGLAVGAWVLSRRRP